MSVAYIRTHYRVQVKRGQRVTVDGRPGVVVSFPGAYLGAARRRLHITCRWLLETSWL